jgi:hypothetical protein
MIIRNILTFLLITIITLPVFSQDEDCELTLTRATDEFNGGHFYAIPAMLSNCLPKFTREQRQRANLLLTQTYLLLDDPIGAKRSYLEILTANPEFVTDEKIHPIDVVYLSKKFTSAPIFSWFVKAGSNVSPIRVIRDLSAFSSSTGAIKEKYVLKPGYQAAIGGDFNMTENIGIRAELNYMLTAYAHKTLNYFENDTKVMNDRQSWLNVPVTVTYSDHVGKYRPYGYIGYAAQYMLNDVANITIVKVDETENKDDSKSPDIKLKYRRNNFNQSIVIGGGVKYKFGLDFLFVDVRYSFGLKNVVKAQNLYANYGESVTSPKFVSSQDPVTLYGHVDDYFRMDNLSISVGFLRPLYKPRELKRARTRSILKGFGKKEGNDE